MSSINETYDEAQILRRLEALSPAHRVLFACSCAERLIPLYAWSCQLTRNGDVDLLRAALDVGWSGSESVATSAELDRWSQRVEELLPPEDEAEGLSTAVAQNAVASVAYVIRVLRTGDPQSSVWAARQLYEAADAIVQEGAPTQEYVNDIEQERPAAVAVEGIYSALEDVTRLSAESLRLRAQEDGDAIVDLLGGPDVHHGL